MATQTIAETAQKIVSPEALRYAAKQSQRCLVIPVRLRRAIKKYLQGPLFSWSLLYLNIWNIYLYIGTFVWLQVFMLVLGL